ncbi:MAG: hypothetical protein Q8K02_12620, partial [Flavobacterium sp.]|nr:hypothetical protein [Flavobacterium sp.]
AIFIMSISLSVCTGIAATPNRLAELTVPFFLYLYLKDKHNKKCSLTFITIILVLIFPYFHPITCLIVILSLFASDLLLTRINGRNFVSPWHKNSISYLPLILLISFLMWMWHNYWFWDYNFGRVIRWFVGQESASGERAKEVLTMFEEYNVNLYEMIIKVYGIHVIYIFICLIIITLLFKKIFTNANKLSREEAILSILSTWVLIPVLMAIALILLPSLASPERMIRYMAILSPFFVGYFILNLSNPRLKMISIFLVIVLSANCFLSIYQSPYIHLPSEQVTDSEIAGMFWFFNYRYEDIEIRHLYERHFRFAEMLIGTKQTKYRNLDGNYYDQKMPNHFGYDVHQKIGDSIDSKQYLILGECDYYIHQYIFPNLDKFNKEDFYHLYNQDSSSYEIYSNGVLTIFYTNSTRDCLNYDVQSNEDFNENEKEILINS